MKTYLAQTSQPATPLQTVSGNCGLLNPAWVPFWQGISWIFFWFLLLYFVKSNFNNQLGNLLDAVIARIKDGSTIKVSTSGIEFGGSLPPPVILSKEVDAATSEGIRGLERSPEAVDVLNYEKYSTKITEEVYLIHEAKVITPRTERKEGYYTVRVWLEANPGKFFDECVSVTYRLHKTFNPQVLTTKSQDNNFELWLNVWGEFTVIAYVERKDKEPLWLTRYLDLPERSPDYIKPIKRQTN